MDLRDELIRLAGDKRAGAKPVSGILPIFPEPGKGERPTVFHGDSERQLRFNRLAPFVESVCRNQASAFCESQPERGRFIDSGVDGPITDLWVFGPMRNESPLQDIERALLYFRIESNGQDLLARRDIITDR
jgi:hypothetical protein